MGAIVSVLRISISRVPGSSSVRTFLAIDNLYVVHLWEASLRIEDTLPPLPSSLLPVLLSFPKQSAKRHHAASEEEETPSRGRLTRARRPPTRQRRPARQRLDPRAYHRGRRWNCARQLPRPARRTLADPRLAPARPRRAHALPARPLRD